MPLVRIDVLRGRSERELDALSAAVQEAMVATLGVPERDRFQIITEHDAGRLRFDPGYLDVERSDAFVLVHVTLAAGRATEVKQAFYADLCERLERRWTCDPRTSRSFSSRTSGRTGPSGTGRRATSCCRASAGAEAVARPSLTRSRSPV